METRLAAIYNAWDSMELLPGSINSMIEHVDLVIIIFQKVSNFGERYNPLMDFDPSGFNEPNKIILAEYKPNFELGGTINEVRKRNIGLDIAREHKCSHFLHVDCDEYYENFCALKEEYVQAGYSGSVCPIYTYFKRPVWRLEEIDGYFVPFIHELRSDTKAGRSTYPYYCDPTRVINESDVVRLSQPMHHYSWVRKDIERKIRNSSAGQHGNKLQGLLSDYNSPELEANPEGFIIKDMGGQKIKIVPDLFGLSSLFSP